MTVIPIPDELYHVVPNEKLRDYARMTGYSETMNRMYYTSLKESMAEDGVNDDGSTALAMRSCYESLTEQTKRMDHALKRLKQKGMWTDTFSGVEKLIVARGDLSSLGIIHMMHYGLGEATFAAAISDSTWRLAMEMTVAIAEPETFQSDSMISMAVERHLNLLYPLAILLTIGIELESSLSDAMDYIQANDEAYGQIGELRASVMKAIDEMEQHEAGHVQRQSEYEKKMAKLRSEVAEISKSARYYESKSGKQTARIEKLETLLAEKTADLEEAEALLAETFPEANEAAAVSVPEPRPDEVLPPLPETGITFAGGHVNMTKKIKAMYPEWRYIEAGDKGFTGIGVAKVVFVWYKHICHPVFDKLQAMCREADVKMVYLQSTNLESLDVEMRRAWRDLAQQAPGGKEQYGKLQ